MVAEIEHLRKAGAGEFGFIPGAVFELILGEELDAPLGCRMVRQAGGYEAQDGPGGLRRGGLSLAAEPGVGIGIG